MPLNYLSFKVSFTFLIESIGIIKAKYNFYSIYKIRIEEITLIQNISFLPNYNLHISIIFIFGRLSKIFYLNKQFSPLPFTTIIF